MDEEEIHDGENLWNDKQMMNHIVSVPGASGRLSGRGAGEFLS